MGASPDTFAASGYNNIDMFVMREWNMVVVRLGRDQPKFAIPDGTYGEFLRRVGAAARPAKQEAAR